MLLSESIPLTTQAVLAGTPAAPQAARKPKVMTKFGDQIVPMSRFRQEALGDSDGIAIVLREGRFMFLVRQDKPDRSCRLKESTM